VDRFVTDLRCDRVESLSIDGDNAAAWAQHESSMFLSYLAWRRCGCYAWRFWQKQLRDFLQPLPGCHSVPALSDDARSEEQDEILRDLLVIGPFGNKALSCLLDFFPNSIPLAQL